MISTTFTFTNKILDAVKDIQVVILDVDGVFTDGGIYINESGEYLKKFNTLDGFGIKVLLKLDYKIIVISGRRSPALENRLLNLGIKQFFLDVEDKLEIANSCLSKLKVNWNAVAVMGDDLPDLPLLKKAKFSCAPNNAHPIIRNMVQWNSQFAGGNGAIRELCDLLLLGNHQMDKVFQMYV